MFTGIVQCVGTVRSFARVEGGGRLRLRARLPGGALERGESIAVDGTCLTVARLVAGGFEADLSAETLRRSAASRLRPGSRVNLERALRPSDRLGGHIVQGHVDAAGKVVSLERGGGGMTLRIAYPPALGPLIAEKGSIAVDGVSLTVAALEAGWFEAALVPFTLAATNLQDRRPGDLVNLEADVLARHVARLLAAGSPGRAARKRGRREG